MKMNKEKVSQGFFSFLKADFYIFEIFSLENPM